MVPGGDCINGHMDHESGWVGGCEEEYLSYKSAVEVLKCQPCHLSFQKCTSLLA